jgi:flavodoxin I
MNTLIIYDSEFGNTEQIARAIAGRLGEHGTVRLLRALEADPLELKEADLLVVGCPTQRRGFTPALRALLENIPRGALQGETAATFDTRYQMAKIASGSAARLIAKRLERAGASLIMPPESFFVAEREGPLEDGELERAVQWAGEMLTRFESNRISRK